MPLPKNQMIMTFRIIPGFLASVIFLLFTGCVQKPNPVSSTDSAAVVEKDNTAAPTSTDSLPDTIKGSIKSETAGKIGAANIRILYSSPAVRGREIWGKLVPHDKVWVTGAHNATSIETDRELMIGGRKIPPGKYAFFTMPCPDEWTVIINKNWDQHQADKYSEDEDLVRLKVKPQLGQQNQERLRYEIVPQEGKKGHIVMRWEKLKLEVPVEGV